ncbi:MAG: hypothetical protein H6579_06175 [Chitinophagales bacterium]|nr:hypothetical protein [Chitinophagales bacterium]
MKNLLSLFLFITLFLIACNKSSDKSLDCVESAITKFQLESFCNSGSSVKSYHFQNEVVFVFEEGACGADFTSLVLSSSCDTLGYLGGITGNAIIQGENFNSASLIGVVWQQ